MFIEALVIQADDPAILMQYYRQVLELPVEMEAGGGGTVRFGASRLTVEPAPRGTHPRYHFACNIPLNRVEAARDWLQPRTGLHPIPPGRAYIAEFTGWAARSVYFSDPAGNIVELIGRQGLDDATEEPFTSMLIRNISEAGLVFPPDLYETAVCSLQADYELPVFARQVPLPGFRALGDDQGLFICVTENRPWFPTADQYAQICPLRIRFRQGRQSYKLTL
ncbi:MAG TPA: hypothetical protein VG870_11645 [Chitinophagaceae bacterium]|nr:hypothetical protein [Chitinophagaceae bacterium]